MARANTAGNMAADQGGLGFNFAFHGGMFANGQRTGADIALDGAVQLNFAF